MGTGVTEAAVCADPVFEWRPAPEKRTAHGRRRRLDGKEQAKKKKKQGREEEEEQEEER